MAENDKVAPASDTKASAQPTKTGIATGKKYEPGFRADGTAYPGVDPDTGERKAVTWAGLREEFGEREGARLYNGIAVAGFGGVPPDRKALSLLSLGDDKAVNGLNDERLVSRIKRRTRVMQVLTDAEAKRAKEALTNGTT